MTAAKKKPSLVPAINPASSLALSTAHLNEACAAIDAGAELTETVRHYFNALRIEQGENVDAVLADINACYNRVEYLRALKKAVDAEIKQRNRVAEAIEKAVTEIVTANPDIPFTGTYEKLSTALNPPSVEWTLSTPLKSKSFENVIPFELVDQMPFHHYRAEQVFVLDLKAIAADLKKDVQVPYAKLTQGRRLNPKPKD